MRLSYWIIQVLPTFVYFSGVVFATRETWGLRFDEVKFVKVKPNLRVSFCTF